METGTQIAARFKETLINGKWVANTNYKELLSDLSWEQATMKIGSLNTIAAITFHINYYIAGILPVFDGGSLDIHDKYSFDAPPILSATDWTNRLSELMSNAEKFALKVEQLSNQQLNQPFIDEKYGTYRRNMEGMIEHCYYHMGQIALIKKMVIESTQ